MNEDWDALLGAGDGARDIRYRCAECDADHRGLPDLAFRRPDDVFALSTEEYAARVRDSSDLCVLDGEHHFLRAVLPVPVVDTDFEYCFGIWVEVEAGDFARYREHFDGDPPPGEGPYPGRLANAIPGYDWDGDTRVAAQPMPDGKRPRVALESGDPALLRHQREGVELSDLLRILQPFIDHQQDAEG